MENEKFQIDEGKNETEPEVIDLEREGEDRNLAILYVKELTEAIVRKQAELKEAGDEIIQREISADIEEFQEQISGFKELLGE